MRYAMSTRRRSARRPSGSSHHSTVNHETTAKKASDTVYTFSFTTLWFHTVKAVALSSAASAAPAYRVHRRVNHCASTRSATRNQTAAVPALQSAASRFTRTATLPNGTSVATRPSSTNSGLPGGCGMPSVYAAVMYSLVSHIAVVGARVSRYSTSTRTPTIAAAPYEGRGASRGREEVMASAGKEGERNEHDVADDERHGCER